MREPDESEQRAGIVRLPRRGRPETEPVRVPVGDGTRLKRGRRPPDATGRFRYRVTSGSPLI